MLRYFTLLIVLISFQTFIVAQDWKDRTELPDDFTRPPKTETSLFFIQRNKNPNTIVYDLNLNADGTVNRRSPIDGYWRRYSSTGVRKELSWFESTLAYGYSSRRNQDSTFRIKLKAYNERYITLKQINGRWKAIMKINNEDCYLTNIYAYADESGIFPDVLYVDIHGINPVTGQKVTERIYD